LNGHQAAQQIVVAELLIFVFIESWWTTIALVIVGSFANPQSAKLKR
jgi:hypothetical protein